MANRKKEMRAASNRRILDAALTEFVKNGYSRTLLSTIAKNACVSNGMITQRFNGKENLYNYVFTDIVSSYLERFDAEASLHTMLIMLVEDIKRGALSGSERFLFITDLLLSKDSPINSFDGVKDLFESSSLCIRIKEALKDGYIIPGEPFEIFRSFLISALGITKYFNESSVGLPNSESYMALLAPRDMLMNHDLDILYSRLSNELIGQLATDYEAVFLVDLESGRTMTGKAQRLFQNSPLSDPSLSLDEKIRQFADTTVCAEERNLFISTLNSESLSERYVYGETKTLRFRTVADSYYQAVVGFNRIEDEGHWITLAFRNIDRQVRDEVRRVLSEAESRKESINARLMDTFDFIAYFDTEKDRLNIYTLKGDFRSIIDHVPKTASGSRDILNIISAITAGKERDRVSEHVRKIVQNICNSSDRIKNMVFNASINMRMFRCLIEIAALDDSGEGVIIGLLDVDKYREPTD